MELNDTNMQSLLEYLQHTLNPDPNIRRPAEKILESVEQNKNYPILLIQLIDKQEIDITLRIAGAVVFKNYICRNWKVVDGIPNKIHDEDRLTTKSLIVDLVLKSPESIQKILSVAVSEIGKHDFPMNWPNLMEDMVQKFASGNFNVINGILHIAHSLFKKYRREFKSETLWREIKFVLDIFAKPLTELMTATLGLLSTVKDVASLKTLVSSQIMICKIFYSLNTQDLPEFFEDNMKTWFEGFMILLQYDPLELRTTDGDGEPSLLEHLRGQICDNISLYAENYGEEFSPFLPDFVTAVWTLLVTTGPQPKYDHLVSNALGFLKSVAERKRHADLFRDPSVLGEICHKVVIPNMEFGELDEELFEDNPEEYIRRYLESNDVDTRRRSACDLVKALTSQFEAEMMNIFGQYVEAMLNQYNANPMQNWKSKNAAVYLVTSLVTRGQTERHGVTQTSQLVNLCDFARVNIFPELKQELNVLPVLKVDAIKYIVVFRSILSSDIVVASLPDLVRHLRANSYVVYTAAALAIEKILVLRTPEDTLLVTRDTLKPLAQDLLTNLFALLEKPESAENEYVMKTIMRTFSTLHTAVIPFLDTLLEKLTQKLAVVSRNPSKPHFNHYLFETLGLSIRIVCAVTPEAVSNFELLLFPTFQNIMQQDVSEFIPYVFQLLSTLLELQPETKAEIPPAYLALLPLLLAPTLWERLGYIKPLVRLLQAAIERSPLQVVADNRLNGILGVFQKLIASKMSDHEGFYLMQHLIQYLPREVLEPFLKQIFILVFTRLQSSKTSKLIQGFIVFICFFGIRYSGTELITIIDSIQPGMFGMVLEKLILQDTQKISGAVEKKIVAIGLIKLLCETPPLIDGAYSQFWVPTLGCLVSLFELPEDTSVPNDEHYIDVEDTPGYCPSSSQLSSVKKNSFDPLREVANPRVFLAENLAKLSVARPGYFGPMIGTLGDAERSHLTSYLTAAKVKIV